MHIRGSATLIHLRISLQDSKLPNKSHVHSPLVARIGLDCDEIVAVTFPLSGTVGGGEDVGIARGW